MEYHHCSNCNEVYDNETLPKTLWEIHKLAERLDPGSEVPSGECECGALTYLVRRHPLKLLAREAK